MKWMWMNWNEMSKGIKNPFLYVKTFKKRNKIKCIWLKIFLMINR